MIVSLIAYRQQRRQMISPSLRSENSSNTSSLNLAISSLAPILVPPETSLTRTPARLKRNIERLQVLMLTQPHAAAWLLDFIDEFYRRKGID